MHAAYVVDIEWDPMATDRTRLIAGVSVPDSPLITDVLEYAEKLSEPYLFNHAVRSWLFAAKIGQMKAIDCDLKVVAVGTILHDIGLTAGVSGSHRFEVNGADASLSFIKDRGLSGRRVQLVWDLVALNSTPSIALTRSQRWLWAPWELRSTTAGSASN
jgi:hypothetical protein